MMDARSEKFERDRADMARTAAMQVAHRKLWHGGRPILCAPGRLSVDGRLPIKLESYVLSAPNFERAEQAIALCVQHGLLAPADLCRESKG